MLGINPTRVSILHLLSDRPDGRTSGEIAEALGITTQTVIRHLRALEAEGLVLADTPSEERSGVRVRYRVHTDRLRTALTQLTTYLLPD